MRSSMIKTLTLILFILFYFISCSSNEETSNELSLAIQAQIAEATSSYQKKEYLKAVSILENVANQPALQNQKRDAISVYYNLACNHALLNNKENTIQHLEKAIELGFANYNHLISDSDLELVRMDPKFIKMASNLKAEKLLWENPSINTDYSDNISTDEKIAGLSKVWSEVKYNYVNFDIGPWINWDSLYIAYLPKIHDTKNTLEFYFLLMEFCAHLHDGHTGIIFPEELQKFIKGRIPIQTRFIEDKIIVTKVYNESLRNECIQPGLEIVEIDGLPSNRYAEKFIKPFWTSNSDHGRNRTIYEYALLRGPIGSEVNLTFKDENGNIFNKNIVRNSRIFSKWEPVIFKNLGNGIGYVNIKSFGGNEIVTKFDSVFTYIKDTKAIIIDLRDNGGGNGRIGWLILGYFTDKPFKIFQWKTRQYRPLWRAWHFGEEVYKKPAILYNADKDNYYSKPVVLLTRPRTGSMAENFCLGFRIMNRGKIIGGPTAGSSGTPLIYSLPGGGYGKVVTSRGMYPDGKEYIGIGIQPDIEVDITIEDIKLGQDRILERAKEYLTQII